MLVAKIESRIGDADCLSFPFECRPVDFDIRVNDFSCDIVHQLDGFNGYDCLNEVELCNGGKTRVRKSCSEAVASCGDGREVNACESDDILFDGFRLSC